MSFFAARGIEELSRWTVFSEGCAEIVNFKSRCGRQEVMQGVVAVALALGVSACGSSAPQAVNAETQAGQADHMDAMVQKVPSGQPCFGAVPEKSVASALAEATKNEVSSRAPLMLPSPASKVKVTSLWSCGGQPTAGFDNNTIFEHTVSGIAASTSEDLIAILGEGAVASKLGNLEAAYAPAVTDDGDSVLAILDSKNVVTEVFGHKMVSEEELQAVAEGLDLSTEVTDTSASAQLSFDTP